MKRIMFVCHGNICRSTMAQSIMQYLVTQRGLQDEFEIDSCATSREEIGNPVHHGTRDVLRRHNIPLVPHRAKQITRSDMEHFDMIVCMERYNITNLRRAVGDLHEEKISLLLKNRDIDDPWYTGDFDGVYLQIMEGCRNILEEYTR